jgi:hypothetical protein
MLFGGQLRKHDDPRPDCQRADLPRRTLAAAACPIGVQDWGARIEVPSAHAEETTNLATDIVVLGKGLEAAVQPNANAFQESSDALLGRCPIQLSLPGVAAFELNLDGLPNRVFVAAPVWSDQVVIRGVAAYPLDNHSGW